MYKRLLSVILIFTIFSSIVPTRAVELDNRSTFVINNSEKASLIDQHQKLRNARADLQQHQIDYLYALGFNKEKIDNITNGEVADALKNLKITHPEYLFKYIDYAELSAELSESKRVIEANLSNLGLTRYEITKFFELNLNINNYSDIDSIREDLSPTRVSVLSTTCHIFRGSAVNALIGGTTHFAQSVYPTTLYDDLSGTYLTIPLNPEPGTREYELKVNMLSSQLTEVSRYVKKLYNTTTTSGIAYNYYLYGEEDTSIGMHEGVDACKGNGNSLYSISGGQIVIRTNPASGLSVLGVYDSTLDVTVIYMHMNISDSIPAVNGSLLKGQQFGTESMKGATGYHTHIQIQSGVATTAFSGKDTTVSSLNPYSYFWFYCYYQS